METASRSIAKAVSYRVLGSTVTGLIVFILTRKISLSAGASALDVVFKLVAYFVHERIWNYIGYGRPKPPDYEI